MVAVNEITIEAELIGARVGISVAVESPGRSPLPAEVASCDGKRAILLPLGDTVGLGPGDLVTIQGHGAEKTIPCGYALLGRVINSLSEPIDGAPPITGLGPWHLDNPPPNPLTRKRIDTLLETGVRAIDGCCSLGVGQRIGLFAGPGLGKSTLLADLAKRARADVSVICLVGERGREVGEFIDVKLGKSGLARSVIVLATADAPPLVRVRALKTATAVAEWFRAEGKRVLLLVDSLTRVLRSSRDVALALGESPSRNGFPPSAFAALPKLLERTGCDQRGSITAVYAILTENEPGDPIAEEARALLDGHIELSQKIAGRGQWPAVDILHSVSRVMDSIAPPSHLDKARKLRRLISAREENEDLVLMGAYKKGTSSDTDIAIEKREDIANFLTQGREPCSIDITLSKMADIVRDMQ